MQYRVDWFQASQTNAAHMYRLELLVVDVVVYAILKCSHN